MQRCSFVTLPITQEPAAKPAARRLSIADLQDRVRQLLDDPSAELLIWCGSPVWAYMDLEGRHRELEEESADRVVTLVDGEGSRLAEIVHEPIDGAELVEQVAAAVALEVERDRFLFELERSERRSRALLNALPDKMFRVRTDGVILDIHENPGHSTTPTDVGVGSSVYDV